MALKYANSIKDFCRTRKNYVIPLCIFLVGIIVCLFVYFTSVRPAEPPSRSALVSGNNDWPAVVSDILQNDRSIVQSFRHVNPHERHFSQISVLVSTHSTTLHDIIIQCDIYDEDTGILLATTIQNFETIEDGSQVTFILDSPIYVPEGNYQVIFTPINLKPNDTLSVWLSFNEDAPPRFTPSQIGGYEQEGSLFLYIIRSADANFLTYYYLLIAIPLVIFIPILWYLIFIKKLKKENTFAVSAIVLGCIYMFVYAPLTHHDETRHAWNVFYYSNMILGEDYARAGDFLLFQLRVEDANAIFRDNSPDDSYHYFHIARNFFRLASTPETFELRTERYGPLHQYLPHAIGVSLARLLNFGHVPTLYLGRLFSLMAYIAIIYFAIKVVPFKAFFCLLGLTPYILLTAGTFTYDTMKNALFFFFVAYTLYLALSRQSIRKRDYLVLLLIGILLAPLKFIYVPILLLPLIIPGESYYSFRGAKILFCAFLFIAGIVSTFVFQGITLFGVAQESLGQVFNINSWNYEAYTFAYLLRNPHILFRLLFVTMADNLFILVGSIREGYMLPIPNWIIFVIFSFFIISVTPKDQESQFSITLRQKIIILFCAVAIYFLGNAAALTWTNIGMYYARGVQDRYFIPLLPLLVIPFHAVFRRAKDNDSVLIFSTALINAYVIIFIFQYAIFT